MWARWWTVLDQTDHSLEQLLLVEMSADTRDSSPEWHSPCKSSRDKLVLATQNFEWTQERGDAWSRSRICHQNRHCRQALRYSKRHWSPYDTETSFIWQSTYMYNHQRIGDYDDQPYEVKAKFYDDLNSVISATPLSGNQHTTISA